MKTLFLLALAFMLPPVAVLLSGGRPGLFFLSLLLTICGWVPGFVHAFYVVITRENK